MSESLNCPKCEGENVSDAQFCRHCGGAMAEKKTENSCDDCGGELSPDAKFCRHCGASQVPAAKAVEPEEPDDEPEEVPAPRPRTRKPRPSGGQRRREGGQNRRRSSRDEGGVNRNVVIFGALLAGVIFIVFFAMQEGNDADKGTPITPPGAGGGGGQGGQGGGGQAPVMGTSPLDITGTITLSPEMLSVAPPAQAIYIIARPEGSPTGMPIAAVKLAATKMPQAFSIGPANAMMEGVSFDGPVELSARWDQDGDPLTKPVNDVIGGPESNPVKPGTAGVDIVLDRLLGSGTAPAPRPSTPPADAPASAPAEAAGDAPSGDKVITGTIEAAPGLGGVVSPTGAFFVIARPAGVAAGPPIAVNRIPAGSLPIAFTLGPQHVMAGGNFDQPLSVTVKWDQDGSAGSQPGDLEGAPASNPVKPGTKDVKVVLSKKL